MRISYLHLESPDATSKHTVRFAPGVQILSCGSTTRARTCYDAASTTFFGRSADAQPDLFAEPHFATLGLVLQDGGEVQAQFAAENASLASDSIPQTAMSRAAFLKVSAVGLLPFDAVSCDDALSRMREQAVRLVDSFHGALSAEEAIRVLTDRIAEVGRPVSHSKKPLPAARARMDALELELAKAKNATAFAADLENRWHAVAEKIRTVKRRKVGLDAELQTIERRERSQRLVEAQRLQARLDEVTQTCFVYSSVREFPLEQTPEVQRALNAAATARAQVDRTQNELAALEPQLREESDGVEAEGVPRIVEVPENIEQELASLEAKIVGLRERAEEIETELAKARERVVQAQQDLQRLPDFSRLGADPIAWLSQLATSFRVARTSRNNAVEKLRRMRADIARQTSARETPAALFARFTDFPAEARDHEEAMRALEERAAELRGRCESIHVQLEECRDDLPSMLWNAIIFAVIAVVCVSAALWLSQRFVYLPGGLGLFVALIAFFRWTLTRGAAARAERDLAAAEAELAKVENEQSARQHAVEAVLRDAGYSSVRELEALHERFLKADSALQTLVAAEKQQAEEAREDCEQVELLLQRMRETFQTVGETIEHEDDVESGALRAMARYQEYRDAKRRLGESRGRPTQLQQTLAEVQAELEACQREEIARALDVRQLLRDAGFREESRFTSVLAALQAYHVRTGQVREKMGRINSISERCLALRARLEDELRDLAKQEEALSRRLSGVGAASMENWQEMAKHAKQYRDAWEERARLQERIEATLRGESIEALRSSVEKDGPGLGPLTRKADEVRLDVRQCVLELEKLAQEEREINLAVEEWTAGMRPLNEIEEDLAIAVQQVSELELELESTAYAASLIEETARERRAAVAARVAPLATAYLRQMTGEAFREVKIGRDLRIAMAKPKKKDEGAGAAENVPLVLLWLSLRLALAEVLKQGDDTMPLLFQEPFDNCDDRTIASALSFLNTFATDRQVIVFSCAGNLASVAAGIPVPVLVPDAKPR